MMFTCDLPFFLQLIKDNQTKDTIAGTEDDDTPAAVKSDEE